MSFNKKNKQDEEKKSGEALSPLKNPLKEELTNKLKELKESKREVVESPGAMCYKTVMLKPEPYVCVNCGEQNKMNGYWNSAINEITKAVSKIKALGYDVELDKKEFCPKCSGANVVENPELVFKIKCKGENEYHQVRTNVTSDYGILLAFLENEEVYNAGCGQTRALKKELKVIEKMTGIKYGE